MKNIIIYSTTYCPYCDSAKRLLEKKGYSYQEIDLTNQPELRQKISRENNGYRTVPMIFIDDKFIGGFSDLQSLDAEGSL